MAKILIDDYHNIDQTPLDVSFPFLCCFWKPIRKCYSASRVKEEARLARTSLKAKLLENKGATKDEKLIKHINRVRQMKKKQLDKMPKQEDDDPYLDLGFGLIAYRKAYWKIILGLIIMVLCIEPVRRIYAQGTGFDPDEIYKFEQYSLANLGYSSVKCANIPFGLKKIVLQCPYGYIDPDIENGIGLNSGAPDY